MFNLESESFTLIYGNSMLSVFQKSFISVYHIELAFYRNEKLHG